MTSCISSWPPSHPWFATPSMKRKHSSTPSGSESSDDSAASSSSSHHAKRRRFSQLERTLSHLSLSASDPTPLTYSRVRGGPTISELGIPRDDIPMIQPTNVIEPSEVNERSGTPSIPEVNMKYSSWYEPEPDRECPFASPSSVSDSLSRYSRHRPRRVIGRGRRFFFFDICTNFTRVDGPDSVAFSLLVTPRTIF